MAVTVQDISVGTSPVLIGSPKTFVVVMVAPGQQPSVIGGPTVTFSTGIPVNSPVEIELARDAFLYAIAEVSTTVRVLTVD